MFRLGLIINPLAGVGGRVALKGSDGAAIVKAARKMGAQPQAQARTRVALEEIQEFNDLFRVYTAANEMGQYLSEDMGFDTRVVASNEAGETTAEDTCNAVKKLVAEGIDLILFAGGDGTARDIFSTLKNLNKEESIPVLGIPAGCKIHSAVYAVTPKHAGELLYLIIRGRPLAVHEASVMDIDEDAFRHDIVKAKRFGQLSVPAENQYMQNMKEGGVEHAELVLHDIASFVIESMEPDIVYFVGSGSTPKAIMDELGLASTLLGIDAIENQQLLQNDVNEQQILAMLEQGKTAKIILTIIGGQGHLLGRGNQQLSPQVIRKIGRDNLLVIATPEKLHALNGQAIRVDSGDERLNDELCGMIRVVTGYDEHTLYRIEH
ncbi:MAG: ATP-NAD kinase family protein [Gammaproteobacteria bacterium]|nr:ATP-NAD kinase family protein [Gammaproteobacteria bacterium]